MLQSAGLKPEQGVGLAVESGLCKDFDMCEFDLIDPCPDVHALFVLYNGLYFEGKLGACSVEWSSKRMTL